MDNQPGFWDETLSDMGWSKFSLAYISFLSWDGGNLLSSDNECFRVM